MAGIKAFLQGVINKQLLGLGYFVRFTRKPLTVVFPLLMLIMKLPSDLGLMVAVSSPLGT